MKRLAITALLVSGLLPTVALAQNTPPVLDPIGPQVVNEGSVLNVRVTASDADSGDVISLTAEQLPPNAVFNDSTSGVGGFTFQPDYSQAGGYQVVFIATDTSNSADTEFVDITVNNVDRPPVIAPVPPQSVPEGGHLGVRITATDPDGNIIVLTADQVPPNASFADSSGGVGGLVFDPDFSQAGNYQVRVFAHSNALADTELVNITVTNVDRPPVIAPVPPQSVPEGGHLGVRITATDPDGNVITLTADQIPPNASFADSSGGVGGLIFNPNFSQAGNYQVRIFATANALADTELVNITVTNVDRPPVIAPVPPQSVPEGGHLGVRITATDPDGNVIVLTADQVPPNASFADSSGGVGGLIFDPDFSQAGNYQVRIFATANALADTELVNITVTNVDRPPVIAPVPPQSVPEGGHLGVRITATDPDGNIIVLTADQVPPNASFADSSGGVGGLIFNPNFSQAGNYQVRIFATANALVDTELVNITVTNVDRPPVIAPVPPQSVPEGGHLGVRITATDPDGNVIALTADQIPPNASFVDSSGGVGGLIFNPNFSQAGNYQVRVFAHSNALADTELVNITVTNVDRPPVIAPVPPQSVPEGGHLGVRITATDPDGNVIVLTADQIPPNASFADSSGGVGGLVFNPDFNQAGNYQVRVFATANALADTELVNITVTNVDRPPVIAPVPPQSVPEGGHLGVRITATDPDGNVIVLTADQIPPNASFADSSGGVGGLIFNPNFSQAGNYQVRIFATANALADTELVNITVTNVDRPPVITPVPPQSVPEGGHLGVRITATDPDGNVIALTADQIPPNASFADSSGGVGGLVFNPDFNQAGNYQVRVFATANALADTELVNITVTGTDRPPVLAPVPPQSVPEGGHLGVRITATDPDGNVITLTADQLPPHASFADSSGGVGGLIFDPDFNQAGNYQVRIFATANALADTELVNITVTGTDRPPVIAPVPPQSVPEGGHLGVRITATDPDGDAITLTNGLLPAHASFTDLGGGTGQFDFDPDLTQEGHYDIPFYASSNSPALRDTLIVSVDVSHTNAPPVLNPIGPKSVNENQTLSFVVTSSDIDGQIPALTALNLPPNAVFTDSLNGHGRFVFTPTYFQAGTYNVLFVASDGVLADSENVTITVNNVNRPPVLSPIGNRSVIEGNTISFRVTSSDPDLQVPALRAENLPVNATFMDSTNGSGLFTFSPGYWQAGLYDIRFIASDGVLADSELVRITVLEAGNQAPVIDSIGPQTVVEGQHLTLLVSASDPDSTIPALQAFNLPANSAFADSGNGHATFTFNPNFNQAGVYNVLFRAFDGSRYDSLWVQITVIDVGFPPVLNPIGARVVNEGATLQFVVTSSDPDGTFPHLSAAPLPTHATFVDSLNGHGLFTFSPDFTQSGVYLVLFIASDGALTDSENVQITVNDVGNMPPILAPIGPRSVNEGDSLFFNISASDPDGTFPNLSAIGLPPNANFTDNLNGSGHFEFRPNFFQAGVYPVLFIASDGTLADSENVQITVVNVNRPPVLGTIGPQSVQEGGTLHVVVMSYDPDGTVPSLSASPLPPNASFVDSLNGDGLFTFQPDYSQSGVYNILFLATDGTLADSEMVQVTVTTTNQPPVFVPLGSQFVFEGNTLSFTVQASDADGQVPSLSAVNLLLHSTFVDNGNGTGQFNYSPDYSQAGVDTVTFYASDGSLRDTLQVEITTVDAGNQWPVLAPIGPRSVNEGQSLQFNVHGSDADGVPPMLGALHLPANAAFFDSSNGVGTFTFNPNFTQAGVDTVLFFATDGQLADSEYVVITINNVNQPPVLQPIGSQVINEGDSLVITAQASDPDGSPVTLSASPLAPHMVFIDHGGGSGSFGFKPDFTQSGAYNVDFIASDGSLADTVAVQITVLDAGNQPPVLAAIDTAYFVTEGGILQIPVSASDADGNVLTLTAAPLVTNMTFVDNGDGTALFTFSPNFLQGGNYPVTFRVFDGTVYDSASTRIYVAEQGNQYPILSPIGPRTVAEGAVLTINISATDPEGFIPFLFVDNPPDSSTFVDNHNGTGQFNYYPDYFSAGVDTVRFLAMDNGGLTDYEDVAITITDVNRAPRIVYSGDTLVAEGATLTGTVTVYDSTDYQPGILSLTHGYLPPNATFTITGNGVGTFTFHPGYNQAGVDSAYFVAVDSDIPPLSASRWIRFTILNSNRRPVLLQPPPSEIDQGDTLVLDITASDPDGDPVILFVSVGTFPRNAEFNDMGGGHGVFVFHPDYTQSGLFIVRFGASDGYLTDYKSALIQVHDLGNQRPTLNPIGSFTMTEGDTLRVHVTSSDPDSTHSVLTASGLVANMVFTDSTNGAGSLIFRPLYYQAGVYNVLIVASDGQYADSEMVVITVLEAGNQAPILANISNQSVTEGTTLRLRITAADPDSTIPILAAHNIPANASFADSSNGRGGFVFSPDFSQAGVYHVVFVAYDRENPALADSQDVTITVNDYNRWPIIDPLGPYTINEGQNLSFTVVSHDPDSTFPILYVAHIPPNSTFNDNGNGTGLFNFTPSYFQAGVDSARFVAADRIDPNLFVTMTVRITILNVNRSPILVPIPDTSIGDGFLLVLNIQASDPDSVFPIMFQRNKPDSATFVDNNNGTAVFRWRPRFVDIGTYNVIFGCRDRSFPDVADSDNVVIEVVSAGNHPPMFTPVPDQHLVLGDTLDLAVTATDIDGDPLVISHVGTLPYGLVFSDLGGGHASIFWIPAENQEGDTLVTLVARDTGGLTDTLRINISVISFIRGDANGNGVLNGVDVVYLVNYLKGVGPPPDPYLAGDANGNGEVNGLDVVYLVNYFKGGGPPPPPVPGGPQRLGRKRVEASSHGGM